MSDNRKISVAIPFYNNADYISDTLKEIINDDRVDEIVICDDKSKESDIDKLKNKVKDISKIKLHFNDKNLGVYYNKINTVSKCNNNWTILLDSDNYLDNNYINKLFEIKEWDNKLIYAPCWAKTFPGNPSKNLDYREYNNIIFGKNECLKEFDNIKFKCLFNTCNYFLPTKEYIQCMSDQKYDRNQIDSLDSAVLFTDWLCKGNKVKVIKDMTYNHRLHPNSNYVKSSGKKYERKVREELLNKIKSL